MRLVLREEEAIVRVVLRVRPRLRRRSDLTIAGGVSDHFHA